jgi:hypothetical protein
MYNTLFKHVKPAIAEQSLEDYKSRLFRKFTNKQSLNNEKFAALRSKIIHKHKIHVARLDKQYKQKIDVIYNDCKNEESYISSRYHLVRNHNYNQFENKLNCFWPYLNFKKRIAYEILKEETKAKYRKEIMTLKLKYSNVSNAAKMEHQKRKRDLRAETKRKINQKSMEHVQCSLKNQNKFKYHIGCFQQYDDYKSSNSFSSNHEYISLALN